MPRYIDADELRDRFDNYEFTEYSDYSNMIDMIDDAPTVDAEPVKHGRWIVNIHKDATTIGQHRVTECSECGYAVFTATKNFCAKMRCKNVRR